MVRGVALGTETGRPGLPARGTRPPRSLQELQPLGDPAATSFTADGSGPRCIQLQQFAFFWALSGLGYKLFLWIISFVKVGRGWGRARMEETWLWVFPPASLVIFPCQVKPKQELGVSVSCPFIQNYCQRGELLNLKLKSKPSKWILTERSNFLTRGW